MNDKFLWVERYAPTTIDECVLPAKLKEEFSSMDELPNLLLIGDAGVGKTTVARVLCETKGLDYMFMNASMENGIDEVRNKINTFASTTSMMGGYKVLLLDEADNLTPDAQKALRALIEQYQNNCRFILTCNFPYKLIDPLRSRLQEYFFVSEVNKTVKNNFIKRMLEILTKEKVEIKKEDVPALSTLVELFSPNWRKVVHNLQRVTVNGHVDTSILKELQEQHVNSLFGLLKAKNFTKMREWIAENMSSGVSSADIVLSIYREMKDYMKPQSLPQAVLIMGEYQQKAAVVANQEVNMVAMCVELMMQVEWL